MPRDPRRDSLYLADIVEASRTIARWIEGRREEWDADEILRNAVLRQLMVVGEAAACLDESIRADLPDIPWRQIRRFRNHAVHAYFSLDWAIVWEVAEADIPALEKGVMHLLSARFPDVAQRLEGTGGS